MSTEATSWVLTNCPRNTSPTERMVLIGLANHAHKDGRNSWISNANLAEYVGCSVRSIITHLQALEAKGIIRRGDQDILPKKIPANRRPIVWDLAIELTRDGDVQDLHVTPTSGNAESIDGPDVQNSHVRPPRGADFSDQGCKNPGSGVQPVAHKPNTNQELNQARYARSYPQPGALPPTPAALRAAERAACDHGAPPGACAVCRHRGQQHTSAPPPPASRRSHRTEIQRALRDRDTRTPAHAGTGVP